MQYEEIKDMLIDILSNPDTATARLTEALDKIKEDYVTRDNLVENLTKAEAKIKDLQDTNMKLFLAQTGKREDENIQTESEDVKAVNEFFESFNKED